MVFGETFPVQSIAIVASEGTPDGSARFILILMLFSHLDPETSSG
jgi:hypothetical protein